MYNRRLMRASMDILRSQQFSYAEAKHSFYRAANAIYFGKIGSSASENVTLQLRKTKCISHAFTASTCPSNKTRLLSIDFAITRFLIKLFNTHNIQIVKYCQQECCFDLPNVVLVFGTGKFLAKHRQGDNLVVLGNF